MDSEPGTSRFGRRTSAKILLLAWSPVNEASLPSQHAVTAAASLKDRAAAAAALPWGRSTPPTILLGDGAAATCLGNRAGMALTKN